MKSWGKKTKERKNKSVCMCSIFTKSWLLECEQKRSERARITSIWMTGMLSALWLWKWTFLLLGDFYHTRPPLHCNFKKPFFSILFRIIECIIHKYIPLIQASFDFRILKNCMFISSLTHLFLVVAFLLFCNVAVVWMQNFLLVYTTLYA